MILIKSESVWRVKSKKRMGRSLFRVKQFHDPIKHIVPKKRWMKRENKKEKKTNSDIPFTYANEIDV
jgi:hypothetical protein